VLGMNWRTSSGLRAFNLWRVEGQAPVTLNVCRSVDKQHSAEVRRHSVAVATLATRG